MRGSVADGSDECAGRTRSRNHRATLSSQTLTSGAFPLLAHQRVLLAARAGGLARPRRFRAAPARAKAQTAAARTSAAGIVEAKPGRAVKPASARRGIADRDQDVAQEAVAADALDRRSGEQPAEPGIVERRELGETRRRQFGARQKIGLVRRPGEFVPRADREAVVAAIDAVADRGGAARAGSSPCARSSDTRCSAAHRAGGARGTPRSGRRRDSAGTSRNGRSRAGRASSARLR